jgi:hypothetical protein
MNGRRLTILTSITGVLALGEFGSAIMIWLEKYPDSVPAFAVLFGVLFLVGTWLLRSGRVASGTMFVGLLCLFEVVSFPGWTRHNALDWIYQVTFAVAALAGLIAAIVLLTSRLRHRATA